MALHMMGPSSVDREVVIRHWLQQELNKEDMAISDTDASTITELLEELLRRTGGQNTILWKELPVDWYHTELTERQFKNLRTVDSPDGLGWDRMANDHSVTTCAENIIDNRVDDSTTPFADVSHIRELYQKLPDSRIRDVVIRVEENQSPPRVVDGNHRAVAVAMYLHETGEFPAVGGYVGIVRKSILRCLYGKVWYMLRTATSSSLW